MDMVVSDGGIGTVAHPNWPTAISQRTRLPCHNLFMASSLRVNGIFTERAYRQLEDTASGLRSDLPLTSYNSESRRVLEGAGGGGTPNCSLDYANTQ